MKGGAEEEGIAWGVRKYVGMRVDGVWYIYCATFTVILVVDTRSHK